MSSPLPQADADQLIASARGGDESAFARIADAHHGELHAHCYRMLGSVQDAEDALQETMLRAWKALDRFEGRSSLRSWLYTIATNTCLNSIEKRPKHRVLPIDNGPPTDPHDGPGEPLVESVWIEPYPDEALGLAEGLAGPDARYEQREAVELAFIAALQLLPPNQRAVLILREVMGYSAKEAAVMLGTSVASITSALQRARETVEKRLPERSQQETLRALGDEKLGQLVDRYVTAWENHDIDTVVEMLTDDAQFSMPPLQSWFGPLPEIKRWMELSSLSGEWHWKGLRTTANGQVALGFYARDEETGEYPAFALNLLTFRGDQVCDVTAFINRSIESEERDDYQSFPRQQADESRLRSYFLSFGLPERLDRSAG